MYMIAYVLDNIYTEKKISCSNNNACVAAKFEL